MCYMMAQLVVSEKAVRLPADRSRVGVRELRQNLSVYLDRVKKSEALTVTEHGQVVAVLRPATQTLAGLDRLIAEGRATPTTRSFADNPPTPRPLAPSTPPLSQILDELREDRF